MSAIHTEGLRKVFRSGINNSVEALKGLSLQVPQGEIFGLLGPNGAGKTTLVKLLLGIIRPTSGNGFIFDKPIGSVEAKKLIGFLPENHRYPAYLTGGQMLSIYGGMAGLAGKLLHTRMDELLELVGMTAWKKTPIKKYSKGMMQRLGLAQALLANPKLVFLDEPTDGIDPVGRKEVRDILFKIKETGTTIFLNSHLLSEVEMLTDRVAILRKGELVRIGTTAELTAHDGVFELSFVPSGAASVQFLTNLPGFLRRTEKSVDFRADSPREINNVIDVVRASGVEITSLKQKQSTLEDLFFTLINEK